MDTNQRGYYYTPPAIRDTDRDGNGGGFAVVNANPPFNLNPYRITVNGRTYRVIIRNRDTGAIYTGA